MPNYLVPFASDAGGDCFCIDIREDKFGQVVLFDFEYFDDLSKAIVFLSSSFSDFILNLKKECQDI
ncbi:SMI1/KNR4 family protein [Pokkaliibacter sp. MBI-7]|uniref:SMI1/KNR4 family protein n=1 Tax=Pokkaliibacter sp. MBI-7 TaxID=3040600 RepID=UPI002446D14A|nr:SMI1/KNR4 family protein [Pokkaliibacter sp. MBI-7]MDH2434002.1 SMI1/KNR4 family protein [Pokkaliibacter sp. MBI-7]